MSAKKYILERPICVLCGLLRLCTLWLFFISRKERKGSAMSAKKYILERPICVLCGLFRLCTLWLFFISRKERKGSAMSAKKYILERPICVLCGLFSLCLLWLNNLPQQILVNSHSPMSEKKHSWHKIADHLHELNFADNDIATAEVKGKKICIGKYKEGAFAFAYKCPHAGGILADGYIDALGNIVCPLHRYKYNMENGRNTSGEGYYLKHWPVELREDGVYVGMEEAGGLFGWFS